MDGTPAATEARRPPTRRWLPDDGVLVHIGPPKTGTTALQTSLAAARPRLREQGIFYPGGTTQHGAAAASLLGKRRPGRDSPEDAEVWRRLARRVRRRSGRVIVSSELFADADERAAARVAADLNRERVQVLITLRPLEQVLSSTWQQDLKGGRPEPLEAWLRHRLHGPRRQDFWHRQAHDELVARWAAAVGTDRVAVLPVDSAEPDRLLRDVEAICGIAPGTLQPRRGNRSLSREEAGLLLAVMQRLDADADPRLVQVWLRTGGYKAMIENRRPGAAEGPVQLPSWAVREAREQHEAMVERIFGLGVEVLGDPRALLPRGDIADVVDLRSAQPDAVPADAAAELVVGLFRAASRDDRRLRSHVDPARPKRPISGERPPRRTGRARRRLRRTVRRLRTQVRRRRGG